MHICCTCFPYDLHVLLNDFNYWHHQILFLLLIKHVKLSNTAFLYLGGFKFAFCNKQIPLKCICFIFLTVSLTLNRLKYSTCRDNSRINSLEMFRPGQKNHINVYVRAMWLTVVTESVHKNSTSEFMLELVGP